MAYKELLMINDYLEQPQFSSSGNNETLNTLCSSGAFERDFGSFMQNPQNVVAAYEDYDYFAARFFKEEVQHNLQVFIEEIDFSGQEQVLSVACGPLIYETFLANYLFFKGKVFGIDISRSLMVYGSKKLGRAKNLYLYETNGQNLPFPNEAFDICFSYAALHWMPDLKKAIREIERVTKKEGFVHITYNPNFAGMEIPIDKLIRVEQVVHDSSFTFTHPGFGEKRTFREIIYRH